MASAEGRAALITLLDDSNPDVLLNAAVIYLQRVPERAVPIFERLEQESGLRAVTARHRLIGYRKGSLDLD